jgi:hypothetical protein
MLAPDRPKANPAENGKAIKKRFNTATAFKPKALVTGLFPPYAPVGARKGDIAVFPDLKRPEAGLYIIRGRELKPLYVGIAKGVKNPPRLYNTLYRHFQNWGTLLNDKGDTLDENDDNVERAPDGTIIRKNYYFDELKNIRVELMFFQKKEDLFLAEAYFIAQFQNKSAPIANKDDEGWALKKFATGDVIENEDETGKTFLFEDDEDFAGMQWFEENVLMHAKKIRVSDLVENKKYWNSEKSIFNFY